MVAKAKDLIQKELEQILILSGEGFDSNIAEFCMTGPQRKAEVEMKENEE